MKLPELGVRRPILTIMIFLGILVLGIVSLTQLPIDLMPDIEYPTMAVITQYPGASAEDVETLVTKIMESQVATVPRISEVVSSSEEGVSAITLRFEWGSDLDNLANDVRERMALAQRFLPDDAEDPMLVKFDVSMLPVLLLGITAEESYYELYDLIDEQLCDPLKRVAGVASTTIMGGEQREIQVNIDLQRLEAYHLSINQIVALLAAENITLPAGNLKMGRISYVLRVPGQFKTVDEINDVVVGAYQGAPIYIRDVAEVEDSFKDVENRVRINRQRGLMVMIQKESDANTVEVADNVLKELPELTGRLPSDVNVFVAMDSSDFIKRSVNNLAETIIFALIFVTLVVLVFLREFRGSFIVAVSIPFSLIISFIFLYAMGYTINIMSLSAIAIAIGMVIDDAIVVYENTYRHQASLGESRREASIFGPSEVGQAVVAATLTNMAIFVPIVFVPGITGIIFRELALVVILCLAASLFAALTFVPMLSSQMMKVPGEASSNKNGFMSKFRARTEKWFDGMAIFYKKSLTWALGHRRTVIITGLAIFVVSLLMLRIVGTEFIPTMDQANVMGNVELPVGTRVEITDEVMAQIEGIFENEIAEREMMFARCGVSEGEMGVGMGGMRSDTNTLMVGVRLVPKNERKRSSAEISYAVSQKISEIPGIKTIDFGGQDMASSISDEKPISVEIYGDDIATTDRVAAQVKALLESIPGTTDVTISRVGGKPELWIEVDRKKASALGLNMAQIASTMRTKFQGQTATRYREGGDEYDTYVRLKESDRQSIENIYNTFVTSPTGAQIPIANIAKVVERTGPLTLERKDQMRVVYVGAGLYGRALGSVVADLREGLSKIDIPEGVDYKIAGSAEDQAEAFNYLLLALILGIVLIYMVMAAQFESLLDPFIIMFSVPFAIVGVIWALLITGKTLNLISYVGMIMLVGIVVKNAIVLIDYINILRARGVGMWEAIFTGGQDRLRPVLMTALTTILGLLPLALSRGEGSEVWSPLAISVIGGLLVSTVITLIFVPTLYSIMEQRVKKNNKKQ